MGVHPIPQLTREPWDRRELPQWGLDRPVSYKQERERAAASEKRGHLLEVFRYPRPWKL